jgi:hypothetical protein
MELGAKVIVALRVDPFLNTNNKTTLHEVVFFSENYYLEIFFKKFYK